MHPDSKLAPKSSADSPAIAILPPADPHSSWIKLWIDGSRTLAPRLPMTPPRSEMTWRCSARESYPGIRTHIRKLLSWARVASPSLPAKNTSRRYQWRPPKTNPYQILRIKPRKRRLRIVWTGLKLRSNIGGRGKKAKSTVWKAVETISLVRFVFRPRRISAVTTRSYRSSKLEIQRRIAITMTPLPIEIRSKVMAKIILKCCKKVIENIPT